MMHFNQQTESVEEYNIVCMEWMFVYKVFALRVQKKKKRREKIAHSLESIQDDVSEKELECFFMQE